MSTTDETVIADQGMVVYTDGGCGPSNPGFIGSGVHGYLFQDVRPKKGAGLSTHILTSKGYRSKNGAFKDSEEVVPTHYLDLSSGRIEYGTNNVAELLAMHYALEKALEYNVKTFHAVADSDYVLKGISDYSRAWIKNNWYRQDGSPVPNANIWKPLLNNIEILKSRGVKVTFAWIRGHGDGTDDSYGNLIADDLATIGKAFSAAGDTRQHCILDKAEGHWKTEINKHPLLCMRSMYFSTNPATQVSGEYYLGNQNGEDELIGTRNSDGAYAVLQLEEADGILEMMRRHQSSFVGEYEKLVKANVGNVFSPDTYDRLNNFGEYYSARSVPGKPFNLYTLIGKVELTSVLDPQRISQRVFDCCNGLRTMLNLFKTNDLKTVTKTDITDILYAKETVSKKKVDTVVQTLKPEYNVGFAALPITANLTSDNGALTTPITLTLGMDLPDRNTLKRLEDMNPVVTVLTWSEAPDVYRYATVITCDGASSIWCGYYSNIIFMTEVAKTA